MLLVESTTSLLSTSRFVTVVSITLTEPTPPVASISRFRAVTSLVPSASITAPAALIVTSSPAAVVMPVRVISPDVFVVRVILPTSAAVTAVPTVKLPLSLLKLISSVPSELEPAPVVTVVKLTFPPPDWSKVMFPAAFVVREVTVTSDAIILSISMSPLVALSAVIVVAAISKALVAPIPVVPFKSIVAAVISNTVSSDASLIVVVAF